MRWTRRSAAPAAALLLIMAALCALAGPAGAQAKGGEQTPLGHRGFVEGGGRVPGVPRDTWVNWQFTDEGDGYGAGHVVIVGLGEWQYFGISETDITTHSYARGSTPVPFDDNFTGGQIQVAWAASDSDSVALQVYVIVKDGADPGDGLDYYVDSNPADAAPGPWLIASTHQGIDAGYRIGSQARVITPTNFIQGVSPNSQASFALPAGTRGKYLNVLVYNPTTVTIDDVTVKIRLTRN